MSSSNFDWIDKVEPRGGGIKPDLNNSIDFEPEILFPENAFNAARIFLAVMAYPERGAGQPGGQGVSFVEALWSYPIWSATKVYGRKKIYQKLADKAAGVPRKRDFEGALNRGMRRIERRIGAYDIVGNQIINGFINGWLEANRLVRDGRREEALVMSPNGERGFMRPELCVKHTPSPRKVVRNNLPRWSERFALNDTGAPSDANQKEKDIIRRGYIQSRPVLHMAHALNMIYTDTAPSFDGWGDYDPLLVLLWNCDAWVWDAIDHAIHWRAFSKLQTGTELHPECMIKLIAPKSGTIMHPA